MERLVPQQIQHLEQAQAPLPVLLERTHAMVSVAILDNLVELIKEIPLAYKVLALLLE